MKVALATRYGLAGLIVVLVGSGTLTAKSPTVDRRAGWDRERQHDERMWAVMRQMMLDFGYSNKVAGLDRAWAQTLTPQQWATIQWPDMPPHWSEPTAVTRRLAQACGDRGNRNLGVALQRVCAGAADPDEAIRGLITWVRTGGAPQWQGRTDLALHFIYAAGFEFHHGAGKFVSVSKEELDHSRGKPYDRDDLAAGLAGTEWVRQSRAAPGWLKLWSEGIMSLEANVPSLCYGTGVISNVQLEEMGQAIAHAMKPPKSAALSGFALQQNQAPP